MKRNRLKDLHFYKKNRRSAVQGLPNPNNNQSLNFRPMIW